MPTFSHLYGAYDVEGSINYLVKQNLLTNVPTWLTPQTGSVPPRTINFDYPEQPLNFPSFGITHLGSEPLPAGVFQGDKADGAYRGTRRFGVCEVNCWVTSKGNANWMRDLRVMRDMVFLLFQQHRAIALYDLTTPSAPSALNAVTRVMELREVATEQDPNPALKRKRILMTHQWVERWT